MPTNAFLGPDLAQIDRAAYSNALLRNQVQRLPQMNRAQDLQIQAAEQTLKANQQSLSDSQRKTAAGLLANRFAAVASSQSPRRAAQAFIGGSEFQQAGRLLGLPVDQFTVTDQDTDELIRQQAQDWATALGQTAGMQTRVQSTFTGRNGNQWIVTADGRTIDTGVPVSQFAQRPVTTGAGIESFDPSRGVTTGVVSPSATTEALAESSRKVKQAEALGAGLGQAQAIAEAEAPIKAERARQQITVIDNVIAEVDAAMANVDWSTVGAVGTLQQAVPGTPAYDLAQSLLTIKANLGFDRLQQMRESSPTGGALGQVAVQELGALQASIASLDQAQSGEQLRKNLRRVREHYENWKRVILQAQAGGGQEQVIDVTQLSDEELMRIISGQ